ncbi:uncharacterized protein BDV14DRAFT_2237 [Aspergillus stella-maris]|uniref:uncharacterized protein n=1 Tax=Aspergillus stella-maris TaxID=1810926 RepID=UPI003CCE00A5
MQAAFRGQNASIITREIRAGGGQLPLQCLRASPFQSPGFAAGVRRTHLLAGCQSQAWSQGVRAGTLGAGKTIAGAEGPFGPSVLGTGFHRQLFSTDSRKQSTQSGAYLKSGTEEVEEERQERLRRETWPRDAFGQSAQRGKLLTTPSRLLKLLIPLPTDHPRDVETIAILTHSQQPLSYLEQLIQAELPPIKDEKDGHQRQPGVSFIAFQYENRPIHPRKARSKNTKHNVDSSQEMEVEEVAVADDKGNPETSEPPDEEMDTYSSLQKPQSNSDSEQRYVRWSHATEIGDFIRDAARAGEFIVAIEGAPLGLDQIKITVPSFNERTHYLRMRLRKISDRIKQIADIKNECDQLAHRGAQRVALGGFGVLASWWLLVYKLTFGTSLGWDTMEPITYLASLSTLMGGYLWFLYHNREISYRSALDFTINARQKKLYQLRGVDLQLWENLIFEGNALRREIKTISSDYDTEWDEKHDERDERVVQALKKERDQQKRKDQSSDEKDGSND